MSFKTKFTSMFLSDARHLALYCPPPPAALCPYVPSGIQNLASFLRVVLLTCGLRRLPPVCFSPHPCILKEKKMFLSNSHCKSGSQFCQKNHVSFCRNGKHARDGYGVLWLVVLKYSSSLFKLLSLRQLPL